MELHLFVKGLGRFFRRELGAEQASVARRGKGECGFALEGGKVGKGLAEGGVQRARDDGTGGGGGLGFLVEEGGQGEGVAVEDGGAGEVVCAVGEEDVGVGREEDVGEDGGEGVFERGVEGGGRVEDDGAGHDVCVAREGFGQGGDDDVGDGEDVDVAEGADGVVYDEGEVVFCCLEVFSSFALLGKKKGGGAE